MNPLNYLLWKSISIYVPAMRDGRNIVMGEAVQRVVFARGKYSGLNTVHSWTAK